jgi:hypothetical protein
MATQHFSPYLARESVFRLHVRWALPAIAFLPGCNCYAENEVPCRVCIAHLKQCFIDLRRIRDLEAMCPHGALVCELCLPKKRRKR